MYNWEQLDVELLSEYKKDKQAVRKFSNKYGMSNVTIYNRLRKLGILVIWNSVTGKWDYIGRYKTEEKALQIMKQKLGDVVKL